MGAAEILLLQQVMSRGFDSSSSYSRSYYTPTGSTTNVKIDIPQPKSVVHLTGAQIEEALLPNCKSYQEEFEEKCRLVEDSRREFDESVKRGRELIDAENEKNISLAKEKIEALVRTYVREETFWLRAIGEEEARRIAEVRHKGAFRDLADLMASIRHSRDWDMSLYGRPSMPSYDRFFMDAQKLLSAAKHFPDAIFPVKISTLSYVMNWNNHG